MMRVGPGGEVVVWCRRSAGNGRQRSGSKLCSQCEPIRSDTKEYGKMLQRTQVLEDGEVGKEKEVKP